MFIQSNGSRVYFPPRGPAGPDGNPLGTVISYMGKTAPKDYLICDGSIYYVSAYPELTTFFEEQFGSKNYFGGDGTSTFAVPDMRNLFLRGYKGEATEQLSGEVGVKQEATEHVMAYIGYTENSFSIQRQSNGSNIVYPDSKFNRIFSPSVATYSGYKITGGNNYEFATSRPVNMAVLYCIKYQTSIPEEDIYSTEEHVVGRWIDGKPLYGRTFTAITPNTSSSTLVVELAETVQVKDIQGFVDGSDSNAYIYIANSYLASNDWICVSYTHDQARCGIVMNVSSASNQNKPVVLSILYTKTTDIAPTGDTAAIPQSNEVQTESYDFYQDYDEEVT